MLKVYQKLRTTHQFLYCPTLQVIPMKIFSKNTAKYFPVLIYISNIKRSVTVSQISQQQPEITRKALFLLNDPGK